MDVVSHEAFPSILSAVAVEANAIAARSFTYGHIQANSTINNSTSKHVFVPYRFESLNPTVSPNNSANVCGSTNLNPAQQKVCNGTTRRYYVSYGTVPNDDFPAITQYFSDIPNQTVAGAQPYEVSVADPISSDPAIVQVGHGRGMSQRGASRWGYGNKGYSGNLTSWSVQWTKPEQLLFHYYTGVHLRDAGNNNALLSPAYRWNPLSVDWGNGRTSPPRMVHGQSYPVSVRVQNTGATNWISTTNVKLSCRWKRPNGSVVNCSTSSGQIVRNAGVDTTVSLSVSPPSNFTDGIYTLIIDAKQGSTFFAGKESGKPWYTLDYKVCVGEKACRVYLPLMMRNYWPPFVETFNPQQSGWQFGPNVTINQTGYSNPRSLQLDRSERAYITINVPVNSEPVISFWCKDIVVGDRTWPRIELYLDGDDVTPGLGANNIPCNKSWTYYEYTIDDGVNDGNKYGNTSDGQILIDFLAGSDQIRATQVLIDDIKVELR